MRNSKPFATVPRYFSGISSACDELGRLTSHAARATKQPAAVSTAILVFMVDSSERVQPAVPSQNVIARVVLKNRAPHGGRIHTADPNAIARWPATIFVLAILHMVEHGRAISRPGAVTLT